MSIDRINILREEFINEFNKRINKEITVNIRIKDFTFLEHVLTIKGWLDIHTHFLTIEPNDRNHILYNELTEHFKKCNDHINELYNQLDNLEYTKDMLRYNKKQIIDNILTYDNTVTIDYITNMKLNSVTLSKLVNNFLYRCLFDERHTKYNFKTVITILYSEFGYKIDIDDSIETYRLVGVANSSNNVEKLCRTLCYLVLKDILLNNKEEDINHVFEFVNIYTKIDIFINIDIFKNYISMIKEVFVVRDKSICSIESELQYDIVTTMNIGTTILWKIHENDKVN